MKSMTKVIIVLALLVAMIATFIACEKDDTQTGDSTTVPTTVAITPEQTTAPSLDDIFTTDATTATTTDVDATTETTTETTETTSETTATTVATVGTTATETTAPVETTAPATDATTEEQTGLGNGGANTEEGWGPLQ